MELALSLLAASLAIGSQNLMLFGDGTVPILSGQTPLVVALVQPSAPAGSTTRLGADRPERLNLLTQPARVLGVVGHAPASSLTLLQFNGGRNFAPTELPPNQNYIIAGFPASDGYLTLHRTSSRVHTEGFEISPFIGFATAATQLSVQQDPARTLFVAFVEEVLSAAPERAAVLIQAMPAPPDLPSPLEVATSGRGRAFDDMSLLFYGRALEAPMEQRLIALSKLASWQVDGVQESLVATLKATSAQSLHWLDLRTVGLNYARAGRVHGRDWVLDNDELLSLALAHQSIDVKRMLVRSLNNLASTVRQAKLARLLDVPDPELQRLIVNRLAAANRQPDRRAGTGDAELRDAVSYWKDRIARGGAHLGR
jgi:hypothetical protein